MSDILDRLSQARTVFDATRKALRPLLDAGIGRDGVLAPLVTRLEQMAAEVVRIEDRVMGQGAEVKS